MTAMHPIEIADRHHCAGQRPAIDAVAPPRATWNGFAGTSGSLIVFPGGCNDRGQKPVHISLGELSGLYG
jgi:hypothetical protein